MRKSAWLLGAVLLVTGCARANTSAAGPVTQPVDPAAVYAALRPPLTYAPADLEQARQVEFVSVRLFNPNTGYVGLARPLWGDQNAPEIAHVLALIRQSDLTAAPSSGCAGGNFLMVRFTHGADLCVGMGGAPGELGGFLQGGKWQGLLPPITNVTAEPREAAPGQAITVHGEGWLGGGDTVTLELRDGAGKMFRLGEVPLERGQFTWTGQLPDQGVTIPPWHYVNLLATVTGVGTCNGDLSLAIRR